MFIGLTPFSIISPLQGSEWLYNYLIDRVYTLSYSISPFQGYWVGNFSKLTRYLYVNHLLINNEEEAHGVRLLFVMDKLLSLFIS